MRKKVTIEANLHLKRGRSLMVRQGYDIIGDIHGYADKLIALLRKLGYETQGEVWGHADRQAIFVGDFVDLGPQQVETVQIVRNMVETGTAQAVLGNHEFNAIAWYLPDPTNPGDYLRPRCSASWGEKNRHQHSAFLAEVENTPTHGEIIEWFLTLPLWLDLAEIRVVHACWHSALQAYLSRSLLPGGRLSRELMVPATHELDEQGSITIFRGVEALTKGVELELPEGNSFLDKYGIKRRQVRARWWDTNASTYRQAALLDLTLRDQLAAQPVPYQPAVYSPADKPVFIGHYWLTGVPEPLSDKVVCVDYSAGKGGPLTAYRWDGDSGISAGQFMQS
jgi:hypothetical protein